MPVSEQIKKIKQNLPAQVQLVAVSKTYSAEIVNEAYIAGHKIFGENRVQEIVAKYEQLPKDIEWHFIGHLQTNKVKYIAPFVGCIQSIDSLSLLQTIDKEARKHNRIIPCLLEIFIAEEETKYGLSLEDAENILNSNEYKQLQNIRISGVMGMATFTDDKNQIRNEFKKLNKIFCQLNENFFPNSSTFQEISMGMSGDYKIGIEEGSTIVRIGSAIFGNRT